VQEGWTIQAIRAAVRDGRLGKTFSPSDVNRAIKITYADIFLPKHRVGNPGKRFTELFVRLSQRPSTYSLR
jgi:hypothetical protein